MKIGHLQEATAAIFLTTALVSGANAHHHDEEASRAKGTEQTYVAQGNQWSAISNNEERDRNIYLGLAILNLGLAATYGALGVSSIRRSREEEQQEAAQSTHATPEA